MSALHYSALILDIARGQEESEVLGSCDDLWHFGR